MMEKIKSNCIIPSAAFSVPRSQIKQYDASIKSSPKIGDLIFGEICSLGHHRLVESKTARLHTVNVGTRAVFVYGTRYTPDQFEGLVPYTMDEDADLFSRGDIVGEVKSQNQLIGTPTKVHVLGYICNFEGSVINARDYVLLHPKKMARKTRGAKVVLCIGTSMNTRR